MEFSKILPIILLDYNNPIIICVILYTRFHRGKPRGHTTTILCRNNSKLSERTNDFCRTIILFQRHNNARDNSFAGAEHVRNKCWRCRDQWTVGFSDESKRLTITSYSFVWIQCASIIYYYTCNYPYSYYLFIIRLILFITRVVKTRWCTRNFKVNFTTRLLVCCVLYNLTYFNLTCRKCRKCRK